MFGRAYARWRWGNKLLCDAPWRMTDFSLALNLNLIKKKTLSSPLQDRGFFLFFFSIKVTPLKNRCRTLQGLEYEEWDILKTCEFEKGKLPKFLHSLTKRSNKLREKQMNTDAFSMMIRTCKSVPTQNIYQTSKKEKLLDEDEGKEKINNSCAKLGILELQTSCFLVRKLLINKYVNLKEEVYYLFWL